MHMHRPFTNVDHLQMYLVQKIALSFGVLSCLFLCNYCFNCSFYVFPETFPSSVMEISENEVDEYYSPKDFHLGQSITLLGHHFLLSDCDGFTKDYYQKNYPEMEMKPIEVPKRVYNEREKVENWNALFFLFVF